MPKESWKIDKFDGGINDYTDPKDLSSDEFVELQDCSVAKLGQIKNMGKPIVNTALPQIEVISGIDSNADGSVDTYGGMIPGRGFFKSPNDYPLGSPSTATSAVLTLSNSTASTNGTIAQCTFEVETLLWLFDAIPSTALFDLDFRLESKVVGGSTILPSSTAGFDINGVWKPIEDFGEGGIVSYFDDVTYDANGTTFSTQNPNSPWWVTPALAERIGFANDRILGESQNKAMGFYKYRGLSGYDENLVVIRLPIATTSLGTQTIEGMEYELMRHSFLTRLVALINGRISDPEVTATLGEFGTGLITLKATVVGTTLNNYAVYSTMAVSNTGGGASVDTTGPILKSEHAINAAKTAGGHFHISGGNVFVGGTATVAEVWTLKIEGPPVNNDKISVYIHMNDVDEHQGLVQINPFIFYSTHDQMATDIAAVCNAISGVGASADTSEDDYSLVIFTASSAGISNGFQVSVNIASQENFFNVRANNEQHILLTLSDKDINIDGGIENGQDMFGYQLTGDAGNYNQLASTSTGYEGTSRNVRGTFLNIFSSTTGSWMKYDGYGLLHPTSDVGGIRGDFDWLWGAEQGEYPEPNFFNDGNKLIMSDGNYNLPNYNMWFGYVDRSRFFWNRTSSDGTFDLHPGFKNLRKWYKWPERKLWTFTDGYTQGSRNPHWCWDGAGYNDNVYLPGAEETVRNGFGVQEQAVSIAGSNQTVIFDDLGTHNCAPMVFQFTQLENDAMGENGFIDWGGTPPDEDDENEEIFTTSKIKWYLAAVYDDNSETLPTHQFKFGNLDYQEYAWNQYPQIEAYIRPISRDAEDAADHPLNSSSSEIMNKLCFPDPRVIGVRLYYTDSVENHEIYWNVGLWHFEDGLMREGESISYAWQNTPEGFVNLNWGIYGTPITDTFGGLENFMWSQFKKPKGSTYEFYNGYNPTDTVETSIRYKHSVLSGNRLFVGNIEVESNPTFYYSGTKKAYNDRMVMSTAGKLSTLPYPDNVFDLNISDGDEITALASVKSKLLQFKRSVLYIVDVSSGVPEQYYISETLRHKGISGSNHFCETSEGIFFFNEYGAWIYDGDEMKNIFVNVDEQDKRQQRIDPGAWKAFVEDNSMCEFNPLTNEVLIVKTHNQTALTTTGDCYVYHVFADAWTYGKERFHAGHTSGTIELSNFSNIGTNLQAGFMAKDGDATLNFSKLFTWEDNQTTDNFSIVTKSTNLGDPRSLKSILGLVVNCVQSSANSPYNLAIDWREGPGHDFLPLHTIANSLADDTTIEALEHVHMFKPITVKGIKSLQLNIYGTVSGDFGINDIHLIFRKYKSDDLTIFKADVD